MKSALVKRICVLAACGAALILLFFGTIYLALFLPTFTRHGDSYTARENAKHWENDAFQARNFADAAWWEESDRVRLEITSFDGLRLVGYYLPQENHKGIVLMMHGYHSTPGRDFASIARFYWQQGYSVCMPYQRTHGESQGRYITFGIKERYDVLAWIEELNGRYGMENDIWVHGISMGCATVVMASGSGYPFNVRGIIADCGFSAPSEIIADVIAQRKLPLRQTILWAGDFFCRHLAAFSLYDYDTYRALAVNETPVLFIHGTKDTFVPTAMSLVNFEICRAPKELLLVEDAIHAISFYQDEELYTSKITAFMNTYALPR